MKSATAQDSIFTFQNTQNLSLSLPQIPLLWEGRRSVITFRRADDLIAPLVKAVQQQQQIIEKQQKQIDALEKNIQRPAP